MYPLKSQKDWPRGTDSTSPFQIHFDKLMAFHSGEIYDVISSRQLQSILFLTGFFKSSFLRLAMS